MPGLLRRELLSAFYRVVAGLGILFLVDEKLDVIEFVEAFAFGVGNTELELVLVFLRPFEDTALVVAVALLYFVEVEMYLDDAVDDDFIGEFVASVEEDGACESLEGVAADGAELRVFVV